MFVNLIVQNRNVSKGTQHAWCDAFVDGSTHISIVKAALVVICIKFHHVVSSASYYTQYDHRLVEIEGAKLL